jgi:hypothetical protein
MTSDVWARVFFTGVLVMFLGAVIMGLAQGSKTEEQVGAWVAFFGAVGVVVAAFAYIWTIN